MSYRGLFVCLTLCVAMLMSTGCNSDDNDIVNDINYDDVEMIIEDNIHTEDVVVSTTLDVDGEDKTLLVRMIDGQLIKPEDENSTTTWIGQFQLELFDKQGELRDTVQLNPLFGDEELTFDGRYSFDIRFNDYNRDGNPDFTIGQYESEYNFKYFLFSIKANEIELLIDDPFSASYDRYSTELARQRLPSGFKVWHYDSEIDAHVESEYVLENNQLVRLTYPDNSMYFEQGFEELTIHFIEAEDRITLQFDEKPDHYSRHSIFSPSINHAELSVQLISREISDDDLSIVRQDIVVVNPDATAYHTFPLFEAIVNDTYTVSSVKRILDFVDPLHIVYVAAVGNDKEGGEFEYSVVKMNIISGEKEIIVAELPDVSKEIGYWRGWFSENKKTLNIIGSLGEMWVVDLGNGEVKLAETVFRNDWPFFNSTPSPNGEMFWYMNTSNRHYELYDKYGQFIDHFPFGTGYDAYPALQWSPTSRYATYAFTYERDGKHVIMEGEAYIIAPQEVRVYDDVGKLLYELSTEHMDKDYVEVAGWLPEHDKALLHYYNLERENVFNETAVTKVNSSYALLDLSSGQIEPLTIKSNIDSLRSYERAQLDGYNHLYLIDLDELFIWASDTPVSSLSSANVEQIFWYEVHSENYRQYTLNMLAKQSGVLESVTFDAYNPTINLLANEWLIISQSFSDEVIFKRLPYRTIRED